MRGQAAGGAFRCLCRGLAAALLAGLSGCARFGYELSTDPLQGSDPFDGLSPVSSAPGLDGGLLDPNSADASDAPRPHRGALDGDSFDQRPARQRAHRDNAGGGAPGGNTPPDDTPPAGACALLGTEQVIFGFDSPPPGGGLQARGAGNPTLTWTASVGAPDPGALDFRNPFGGNGEVFYNGPIGDLRARSVVLNVQIVSGSNVRVRLFAESGSQRRRVQGAYTSPALAQWDCVRLDPSAPAAAESGFDARNVVGLGLEIEGSGSVRVYLDQIAY